MWFSSTFGLTTSTKVVTKRLSALHRRVGEPNTSTSIPMTVGHHHHHGVVLPPHRLRMTAAACVLASFLYPSAAFLPASGLSPPCPCWLSPCLPPAPSPTALSMAKYPQPISRLVELSSSSQEKLLKLLEKHSERFDTANITTVMDRLAQKSLVDADPAAVASDPRFGLLLTALEDNISRFAPGHISSLLSSFAKLGYRLKDDLISRLVSTYLEGTPLHEERRAGSFTQQVRLLAALVSLDYHPPLVTAANGGAGTAAASTRTSLIPLLDSFRPRLVDAFDPFVQSTSTTPPSAKSSLRVLQEVSTGLWALAAWGPLGGEWSSLLSQMLSVVVHELERQDEWWPEGWEGTRYGADLKAALRRVKQATLMLRLWDEEDKAGSWKGGQSSYIDELLQALVMVVDEAWMRVVPWPSPKKGSRLQRHVGSELRYLGVQHMEEWEDDIFSIDFVLYPREEIPHSPNGPSGLPVLLEVDGPHHFFHNEPFRPRGETLLKHRLLQKLARGPRLGYGWHQPEDGEGAGEEDWVHISHQWAGFISIAHYEWPRGATLHGDRRALLESKLVGQGMNPARFIAGHKRRSRSKARRYIGGPVEEEGGEEVGVVDDDVMEEEEEEVTRLEDTEEMVGMTSFFGRQKSRRGD